MRIGGWLIILCIGLNACVEQPVTRTGADAIELGFEAVECSNGTETTVYAFVDSLDQTSACAAFRTALSAAAESGLVGSRALMIDSIALAVVSVDRFSHLPSRPAFPDSGFAVTIDLIHREHNLLIAWPTIDRPVDVSWAPEGLKY